jgi:hypothetical protein
MRIGISRNPTRALLGTVVAALALVAALAAPASASLTAHQEITTTHGLAAQGSVYGKGGYTIPGIVPQEVCNVLHPILAPDGFFQSCDGTWVPRQPVLAPNGNEVQFTFDFTDPTKGTVTESGIRTPVDSSVNWVDNSNWAGNYNPNIDITRAWAGFHEAQRDPSTGQMVWTGAGQLAGCNKTFNPTTYSDSTPGAEPGAIDDVWFNVTGCNDGLPYDYYQVHFYEDSTYFPYDENRHDCGLLVDPGPHQCGSSGGGTVGGTNNYDPGWSGYSAALPEFGAPAVCGHKPTGGFDCYTWPGSDNATSGQLWPDVGQLKATN